MKLTEAMRDGLEWLHHDGSLRSWASIVPGTPSIAAMQALVRRKLARKEGGNGSHVKFGLTEAGRAALSQNEGDRK